MLEKKERNIQNENTNLNRPHEDDGYRNEMPWNPNSLSEQIQFLMRSVEHVSHQTGMGNLVCGLPINENIWLIYTDFWKAFEFYGS